MIKAIIFDFGDVFINLNKKATEDALQKLGLEVWNPDLDVLNMSYEKGLISEKEFFKNFQKHIPKASIEEIHRAWNSVLADFPLYRLEFLQTLPGKFRLFLMSNTDATHIHHFENVVGSSFSRDFYNCFERIYFSFENKMRKPEPEFYNWVLIQNDLQPKNVLFVDDNLANIETARSIGLHTWHLQVGTDDVSDLLSQKVINL